MRLRVFALLAVSLRAAESDALAISERIAARHTPFGTIVDPMFEDTALDSGAVTGYTRCGDSAIWTGHWLAAESYRYAVTQSPEALAAVRRAIDGVWLLVEVTGSNLLARCAVLADSPHAEGMLREEAHHGAYDGILSSTRYRWVGNTSRDQYSGVLFGLAAAWDHVDDPAVRVTVRDLVSRLLWRLRADNWAVRMPDGRISTTFSGRADQQIAFLKLGREVNPGQFESAFDSAVFWSSAAVPVAIGYDVADDHTSYFKFNLDAINLFTLLRHEGGGSQRWFHERAYDLLRRTVDNHGNAHFHMIDRALRGPDAGRDAETRALLDEWLTRGARDEYVDLRESRSACRHADRACEAIPVPLRVRTDFLWQRSPFLLYGGGSGRVENAGIDYILPYWMARYYGVL